MVEITVEGGEGDVESLRDVAQRALVAVSRGDAELSVVLCDDAFIQPLNAQWRDKDFPTDVLSFPQGECPGPDLLGDVVISTETAARHAASCSHSLQIELEILLIHGLCHLLGYDHLTDADALTMRAEEGRILIAIGARIESGLVSRAQMADDEGPIA